jgi:serine/threonine-protein kinase
VTSDLAVRFVGRSDVESVVRAALVGDIVYLPLPQPPPAGRSTLRVYLGDDLVAALTAELVGSGRDGSYPLRMGLLDAADAPDLERSFAAAAPSTGFAPEDKTLARRASLPRRTPPPSPSGSDPVVRVGRARAVAPLDSEPPTLPWNAGVGVAVATVSAPGLPSRAPSFAEDESQTLPGSTRTPGIPTEASWNVHVAPTTKDALCGRAIGGGKYMLDSVIGTGAMGIVFKASHRDLARTVAIKVLNPRYRDDAALLDVFRTEARAASQLEHPNVARVYDYGQEPDGLVYIVMEYLSGYTLGSVLDARRKLTAPRALDLMVQVCAGLSAAHDRDIVHRDVKPDNIVLVPTQDDEGHPVEIVKVCDFGIAALGTAGVGQGVAVGTPRYMAPEQTTGSAVRSSADVYACGVLLYEMLTGEAPFMADEAYRILMKHRDEPPRPPSFHDPAIPAALEAIVLRCMEKLPQSRYQSARELRVELRKLVEPGV